MVGNYRLDLHIRIEVKLEKSLLYLKHFKFQGKPGPFVLYLCLYISDFYFCTASEDGEGEGTYVLGLIEKKT